MMESNGTILSDPSNGLLSSIEKELARKDSVIENLKQKQAKTEDELAKAKAEAEKLRPELFAKYIEMTNSVLAKEQALQSQRAPLLDKVEKSKTAFHASENELVALDHELAKLRNDAQTGSELLYAKVDLYTSDLKKQCEQALESAKKEKSIAETARAQAQDLVNKASEQLQKVHTQNKSILEKLAKDEASMKLKVEVHQEEIKKMANEKAKLERQIQYLADLYEQRKKLEQGIAEHKGK